MIEGPVAVGPSGNQRMRKVLVIDDNATIVELVRHAMLQRGGFEVIVAYNGVEGLEQFYRERPDCVVVDVKMPELDGFKVVRAIRGDTSSANTPLVILSALHGEDETLTGLLSGVDAYVPKPFAPSLLVATLDRVMAITPDERSERIERLASAGEPGDAS
ncbi:MAG TPA: response regulator [Ktedonobacterales bacterium]|nr:response regulator [Ktedonobacterales bacterium]